MKSQALRPLLKIAAAACTVLAMPIADAGIPLGVCGDPLFCTAPTLTPGTGGGSGARYSTEGFVGMNWVFGVGPELVVGVRNVRTTSDLKVSGVKLEATFPIANGGISLDALRVRLLGGQRSAEVEFGGGYSFASHNFLLSGALQLPYVIGGVDYVFGTAKWKPYVGFNSLNRPKAPKVGTDGTLSCDDPFLTLRDADEVNADAEDTINGQTCAGQPV